MRSIFTFSIIFVIFASCSGMKSGEKPKSRHEDTAEAMEKVYVDAVEIKSPLTANNQVNLIVRGNLPSPAYHLDKVNVQVIGNDIEITPLAVVAKNIAAAQVLVPFEKTIAVKVDKPGPYRVHLNGRTQSVIHEITLQ